MRLARLAAPLAALALAAELSRRSFAHTSGAGALIVDSAGAVVGTRPALNFAAGPVVADNPGANRVDVTIAAATGPTLKRKAGDEIVNNSAALQNDDDLFIALAANEVWSFECVLFFDSAIAADLKVAFTVPAGATVNWADAGHESATNTVIVDTVIAGSGTVQGIQGIGVGTLVRALIHGFVINGANAGNLQLQWAQNTADPTNTTVRAGSYLICHRLA